MSGVRVLVGTRKGAFILTSDGKRERWNVSGPHFAGWEIYHLKGSPVDPNRLYASQTSGWFGQIIQRSCDGGKTWETPGGGMTKTPEGMPAGESNKFVYDSSPDTGKPLTTHQWYDGTQHPWEFKRVWRSEEHTSELQSQSNLVCRLLLEKKNATKPNDYSRDFPPKQPGEVAGLVWQAGSLAIGITGQSWAASISHTPTQHVSSDCHDSIC